MVNCKIYYVLFLKHHLPDAPNLKKDIIGNVSISHPPHSPKKGNEKGKRTSLAREMKTWSGAEYIIPIRLPVPPFCYVWTTVPRGSTVHAIKGCAALTAGTRVVDDINDRMNTDSSRTCDQLTRGTFQTNRPHHKHGDTPLTCTQMWTKEKRERAQTCRAVSRWPFPTILLLLLLLLSSILSSALLRFQN